MIKKIILGLLMHSTMTVSFAQYIDSWSISTSEGTVQFYIEQQENPSSEVKKQMRAISMAMHTRDNSPQLNLETLTEEQKILRNNRFELYGKQILDLAEQHPLLAIYRQEFIEGSSTQSTSRFVGGSYYQIENNLVDPTATGKVVRNRTAAYDQTIMTDEEKRQLMSHLVSALSSKTNFPTADKLVMFVQYESPFVGALKYFGFTESSYSAALANPVFIGAYEKPIV